MKRMSLLAAMAAGIMGVLSGCSGTDQSSEIKVISYNIRTITGNDEGEGAWDVRKAASVTMILTEKPDVIGFQEPWNEQIEYLAEQLPQYGALSQGREEGLREDGGEHLLIMWNNEKYDLLDSGHFWLSETPDEVSMGWDAACYRITLWVKLSEKSSGKEFYYFDTHLDHVGDIARQEEARLNVEKMKEIAGEDAVVFFSGDMNVSVGSAKEGFLAPYTEWMVSARDAASQTDYKATFNGFGKDDRQQVIDYIYCRNAEAATFETLDGDGYGVRYISDHFPVSASFTF